MQGHSCKKCGSPTASTSNVHTHLKYEIVAALHNAPRPHFKHCSMLELKNIADWDVVEIRSIVSIYSAQSFLRLV